MDTSNFVSHWQAAEAALVKAASSSIANSTRDSYTALAQAELQACHILLMYPDVSFGKLP